ncbi:MAG: cytochrome ubiquinol oxidase subunit I, partial [Acidimicrobiales bacterium]|nr:cytochrome ubiquinol oxidase subunit I [Acidimicrobiales bacterium]
MTTYAEPPVLTPGSPSGGTTPPPKPLGKRVVGWMTTTDHKVIGNMYMVTSFGFFLIGGLLAMVIRAELFNPGLQFVSDTLYNQM